MDKDSGQAKLVVGLGNPGRKYDGTRHNIGFDVMAQVRQDWNAGQGKKKFRGDVVDVRIRDQRVWLLSPETFMNASGASVQEAVRFYQLPLENILVVCDDFALDLGRLRVRSKGSSGGQNGLKDIIRRLGSDQFPRLRVGIGHPPENWDVADYVLSKFSKQDETEKEIAVRRAADAVADWVCDGVDFCMNRYNGK